VEDIATMVGRAAEEAVRRGATSMTVRFADGTSRRWQVLPQDQTTVATLGEVPRV
jgi:hypothetical protein